MTCEKCLHYDMCLKKFRSAKESGLWECTDEKEYFAHADDCDLFITPPEVVANIFKNIESHSCVAFINDNEEVPLLLVDYEFYKELKKKYEVTNNEQR